MTWRGSSRTPLDGVLLRIPRPQRRLCFLRNSSTIPSRDEVIAADFQAKIAKFAEIGEGNPCSFRHPVASFAGGKCWTGGGHYTGNSDRKTNRSRHDWADLVAPSRVDFGCILAARHATQRSRDITWHPPAVTGCTHTPSRNTQDRVQSFMLIFCYLDILTLLKVATNPSSPRRGAVASSACKHGEPTGAESNASKHVRSLGAGSWRSVSRSHSVGGISNVGGVGKPERRPEDRSPL